MKIYFARDMRTSKSSFKARINQIMLILRFNIDPITAVLYFKKVNPSIPLTAQIFLKAKNHFIISNSKISSKFSTIVAMVKVY